MLLDELKRATFQNFYIREGEIKGLVSPKDVWKIREPEELKAYYIENIKELKEKLKRSNFGPFVIALERFEKMLKKLSKAMEKLNAMEIN